MKIYSLGLALSLANLPHIALASAQSEAFLSQKSCRNFVRLDEDQVLLGGEKGLTRIDAAGQTQVYGSEGNPRDAVLVGSKIYALFPSSFVVLDRDSGRVLARYATQLYKAPDKLLPQEQARSLSRSGNRLLIAHGTLGVSVFDLIEQALVSTLDVNRGERLKGMAVDVDFDAAGKVAYVLVDNYQINPIKPSQEFRGILLYDLQNLRLVKRLLGLDPGATSFSIERDQMLISFGGMPFWKLQLPLGDQDQLADSAQLVWDFGREGHSIGHFASDAEYVWTCHRESSRSPVLPALYTRDQLGL